MLKAHQPTYVIGVDGGASKTAAVVVDALGDVLGRGRGDSANYQNVGLDAAKQSLDTAMRSALSQAGLQYSHISAATWALAGVDRPEDRQLIHKTAIDLLPDIPVQIENDALAALMGGLGTRRGLVLSAGTGMIAYGEDGAGNNARAGGWGRLFDHGSGYALAGAALNAIAAADDGRDHPTRLTDRILSALNLEKPSNLIGWLVAHGSVTEIAAITPHLLAEAEAGDMLAVDIAVQGADALAKTVVAVAQQLGLDTEPVAIALSGGLMTGNIFYRQLVCQAIHNRLPNAGLQLPLADAAVGAAWLALENSATTPNPKRPIARQTNQIWTSEQRNIISQNLDLGTTLEIVGLMHTADQQAVSAVRPCLPTIATVVDAITDRMRQGGRLIYVGAGTSGRLGVLDASECPPTFNTDPDQVIGVIAGGQDALTSSIEGAEDNHSAGAAAMADLTITPLDSVVGIAASGRTPYVVGALEAAGRQGALTVALTCNLPAVIAEPATHVIAPLVGAEIITGSTRLKAGTAQKLVLNMLSTAVMVRLGKTFGNLMVDVQQSNQKLQARAVRIVAQACTIDEITAQEALTAANGEVKVAIVSALLGCSVDEARRRLNAVGGVVREA